MNDGRYVVVTGGASGIGLACSESLARMGCHVIVVDLESSAATEVARAIGGSAVVGDLGTDCEAIASQISSRTDSLWGLVNSAGTIRKSRLEHSVPDDFDLVYRVNLRAPMVLSVALLPLLKRARGSIVNVASMSGLHPQPGGGMYSPTKAGLISFTELSAVEFAEYGVRVNAICPGLVRTPMSERGYLDPSIAESRRSAVPLGRIGTAEDMAAAVVFLLSEGASYISGVSLEIDGGVCKSLMTNFP